MKGILYDSVTIEGFGSVGGSIEVPLADRGLTLVVGVNGAGKSTLFNALQWAEFGENWKKSVATWEDKRPPGFQGTRVIVLRRDEAFQYAICRHLKYKGRTFGIIGGDRLMIFKKPLEPGCLPDFDFDEEHLMDLLDKKDANAEIERQLGMDYKAYSRTVLFGQRVQGIVGSSNEEKRLLFERLFDAEFIEQAKERAKAKASAIGAEMLEKRQELTTLERTISANERAVAALKEHAESRKLELAANLKKAVDRLDDAYGNVHAAAAEYDKCHYDLFEASEAVDKTALELELRNLKDGLANIAHTNQRINDDIVKAEQVFRAKSLAKGKAEARVEAQIAKVHAAQAAVDSVPTTCPRCEGSLDAKKVAEEVAKRKADLKALKADLKDFRDDLAEIVAECNAAADALESCKAVPEESADQYTEKIADIQSQLDALAKATTLFNEADAHLKEAKMVVTSCEEALKDVQEALNAPVSNDAMDELLREIKDAQDEHAKEAAAYQDLEEMVSKVDWWVKKGFGASGLKAYVFHAMLETLNAYLTEFAERLGIQVEFVVDITKESKPFQVVVYKDGAVRDYADLSGGQKQRVDVCIAFALHRMLEHKVYVNLLVLDEVFEGLDTEGVEAAFSLIRMLAEDKGKSIFVVTHNALLDSYNCETLLVGAGDSGTDVS